jgi:AP-3 complex subunit sigma
MLPAIDLSLVGGHDAKLIYRHYATLYFVFCVDSSESELGILDLIQVPTQIDSY